MCVCVSLSVHHILKTTQHKFFCVYLWRRCDVLCTSGSEDGVIFSHNGQNLVECSLQLEIGYLQIYGHYRTQTGNHFLGIK